VKRGAAGGRAQKADIPIIAQGMFRHIDAHSSEFLPHSEAFPEAERASRGEPAGAG